MNKHQLVICIAEPASTPIFDEMAQLLRDSLHELGCDAQILHRQFSRNHINLILAPHQLSPENIPMLPENHTIIINAEPLASYERGSLEPGMADAHYDIGTAFSRVGLSSQ